MESSSSSDEEILEILSVLPRPKIFRDRTNPFEIYDDIDFRYRFRVEKRTFLNILEEVGPHLEPITHRNMSVSASMQLLIALRFYSTGGFQILIGDTFNLHKSTVCKILKKVTHHIALLGQKYIRMPRCEEEIRHTQANFYAIHKFPGVLGCIDCTHIPIQSPGGNTGELYRNRKSWFSVNVQAVCNAHLKFCEITACFPGSVHDSTIFNSSLLRAQFENDEFQNSCLLGDSGYSCKEYMMTPLLNPLTSAEMRYNEAHIHTRNTIERAFGVWKRRFPCIASKLRTNISTTLAIIVATAVLHNICLSNGDDMPANYMDIMLPEDPHIQHLPQNRNRGYAARQSLIDMHFS